MNNPSQSSPSRRFFRVLAVAIALPLIALVPAFLASSLLTHDVIDQFEPIEQAAAIDVTDIDPEGTVRYNVSPPIGDSALPDSYTNIPRSLLEDADMLHITIQDDDDLGRWLGHDSEGDCSFTLHLRSDDPYDDQSDTFTGYISVTDDDFYAYSDPEQQKNCGLYVIYAD